MVRESLGAVNTTPSPTAGSSGSKADDATSGGGTGSKLLDHDCKDLQRGLHCVADNVQRLSKRVDFLSDRLKDYIGVVAELPADTDWVKRLEKIHTAEMANLEMRYRLEADAMAKDRAADKRRLDRLELDLEFATMKGNMAAQELAEVRLGGNRRVKGATGAVPTEDADQITRSAFLSLRESVLDFTNSSAIQLGPLPEFSSGIETFSPPHIWNSVNTHQRRRRVMAQLFYLLFRRILRPGLRVFGVQAFIKNSKHHAISIAEAHLRALERELEARRVDNASLAAWRAATIDTTAPLRDLRQNVEGLAQEIFESLSPVIKLTFSRNAAKVKQQLSTICEEAVHLKLAMRRHPSNYKIEVPSRDAKTWGEPGCDDSTRALKPALWLQVVDHEVSGGGGGGGGGGGESGGDHVRAPRGDVACIPFGALTKFEEGPDGEMRKVVLERGWVVARGPGPAARKRAAEGGTAEEQALKRIKANNPGISSAQLSRIKALMSDE